MGKILVTGAAGYIGSHVCQQLKASGFEVIGVDNYSRGNGFVSEALQIKIIEADISDEKKIDELLTTYHIDGVMHLAAFAYVGESVEKPHLYFENNVSKSIKFFEILDKHKIKKIVFSSSCAVYGTPKKFPLTENEEKKPINPYGWSKLICEQVLESLSINHSFSVVSLRYFNVAGGDPTGIIGESHHPETHLIPKIFEAYKHGTDFQINGDDFNTEDGTCVRDFVHVLDIADAHLKAFNFLNTNKGYFAFNLSNEKGYSVREIIGIVEGQLGGKLKTKISPRRPGDPDSLIGGFSLAKDKLGWQPYNSQMNKIIADSWNWFKKLDF